LSRLKDWNDQESWRTFFDTYWKLIYNVAIKTGLTDAEAQAAMKKAVEIDALADLELQTAEQINQQLQTAAPGSAAILEAQTSAWLVRANAYTQSAMAELVRVRSIELANNGAQIKFSAAHASSLHNAGSLLLQGAH